MSTDDTINELEKAITELAQQAGKPGVASKYAEQYGRAALYLAEAQAWLRSPFQPHGGAPSASD